MVMAGLATSSHMISATLLSLGKICSVYRGIYADIFSVCFLLCRALLFTVAKIKIYYKASDDCDHSLHSKFLYLWPFLKSYGHDLYGQIKLQNRLTEFCILLSLCHFFQNFYRQMSWNGCSCQACSFCVRKIEKLWNLPSLSPRYAITGFILPPRYLTQ